MFLLEPEEKEKIFEEYYRNYWHNLLLQRQDDMRDIWII